MKRYLFYLLLCCFVTTAFSQNKPSIDFVVRNLGINVDGHFNTFSVTTKFNATNTQLESIIGSIAVASIETGIDSRDKHLLEEDYFNSEKYKLITLKSESIIKVSENQYKAKVNLKIKGTTKTISVIVNIAKANAGYKVSSSFEINRKDFKVGGNSFVMSKTVKVNVIHYQKL